MKYLLVDDNPGIRELIKQEICLKEDSIIEYSDGEDAFAAYEKHLPDVVLMDIKMERMNGINATKLIIGKFPFANIIILTDYDTPVFRKAARDAGASAFFPKDNLLDVKEFINTLTSNYK